MGCPSLFAVITKSDGLCVFAAESGSQHSECRWHSEIPGGASKQKSTARAVLFCLERCVPQAERDVHFVRDVSFGSDVRFAREEAEHITSLCDQREQNITVR